MPRLYIKIITVWITHNKAGCCDKWSRVLQLFSQLFIALATVATTPQKTMGIIASLLFAGGLIQEFKVPLWVVLSAHAAMDWAP